METPDSYPTLLSSREIPGGRALKNRIVMPPLVIWQAEEAAEVTEAHLAHYRHTAPGCGLVLVEATTVSPEGRLAATQLGLFDDRHVPGLRSLAETIRTAGALPGIQIHHAGARTDRRKTWGATPLAPSPIPGKEDIRELTDADIRRIIDDFGAAAARAVSAGFELLEIHGAHGYLGSQFLSLRTNQRTDQWGGSRENRRRFLLEVIRSVRAAAGDRVIVSCRLGIAEAPAETDAAGLTVPEGLEAARALVAEGLDMLHISHGGGTPAAIEDRPGAPDPVLQLARPVKESVSVPVIGVGGIVTPADAEAALTGGYCDLVAVGRGMLADPQWAYKTVSGRAETIERCVHCSPRCFHFKEPEKCPARRRLGIGPPGK